MNANIGRDAFRATWVIGAIVGTALLAGCSAAALPRGSLTALASSQPISSPAPATTAPTPVLTPTPETTSEPTSEASATSEPSAVATSIDPCTIVSKDEVAKLSGLGSVLDGQESSTPGHAKLCTYGEEGVSFVVVVAVAPDEATAKREEASVEKELQKAAANGLTLTELKGFANGAADAAVLEGSKTVAGRKLAVSAIYVLKGNEFFGISDFATLGAKPPSSADLQEQALTTLGRLP